MSTHESLKNITGRWYHRLRSQHTDEMTRRRGRAKIVAWQAYGLLLIVVFNAVRLDYHPVKASVKKEPRQNQKHTVMQPHSAWEAKGVKQIITRNGLNWRQTTSVCVLSWPIKHTISNLPVLRQHTKNRMWRQYRTAAVRSHYLNCMQHYVECAICHLRMSRS